MLAFLAAPVLAATEPDPPNVVLIFADDVGLEAFGCYGGTSYETPNVDALAESGMRFTHAFSTPLCTPSRVKLMTGRSNARNYVHFSILDRDEVTFAHLLRDAGYATGIAGKWQLYAADTYGERAGTGTHPRDAGFDAWCMWQVTKVGSRFSDPLLERDGEGPAVVKGAYGPEVFCDYLLDFIEEHRDERFLAYYPMALLHKPFVRTPLSPKRETADEQTYFADMVAYLDHNVGRIVAKLDELGLRGNTLLIFTSDNGTHSKIVSRMGDREVRGGKGTTTDAATRVPFLVSWPGAVEAGGVCDDLVDLSDVLPTLSEACELELPKKLVLDGRNFLPQLRGDRGNPREWIRCYYNPRPGNKKFPERRYARDRRYKLYGDGRFYDLTLDADEASPLKESEIGPKARRARAKLERAIETMPEPAKIAK